MIYDLQKASLTKRFAAWLLDMILVAILAAGIAWLLSAALGYDAHSKAVDEAYARYETEYGVVFDVTQDEYQGWPEEKKQVYDEAYQALTADRDAMYAYNMVINLTMLILTLSLTVAILVLEFVIPLLLKNGQTLGKKVFSLCVIRTDCVKANTVQLFVRALLGRFALETMIPVYLVFMVFWGIIGVEGTLLVAALALAQIIIVAATKRHAAIHDLLSGTVVAELSSQMIFSSTEDLIAYQKKIAADLAKRQPY